MKDREYHDTIDKSVYYLLHKLHNEYELTQIRLTRPTLSALQTDFDEKIETHMLMLIQWDKIMY